VGRHLDYRGGAAVVKESIPISEGSLIQGRALAESLIGLPQNEAAGGDDIYFQDTRVHIDLGGQRWDNLPSPAQGCVHQPSTVETTEEQRLKFKEALDHFWGLWEANLD